MSNQSFRPWCQLLGCRNSKCSNPTCRGSVVHGSPDCIHPAGPPVWDETVGMLGIKHRSEVCVSILFWSVILGVQVDLYWETLYCFTFGMLWCCGNQEMLNVRLLAESVWVPRCCGTSVGKASRCLQRQSNGVRVLLCWLSIWDSAITLLIVFLLLADQKLLWRPAKLPALDFSLRRFNHNRWQAVLELAAAVKVWGVREYLKEAKRGRKPG